MIEVESFDDKTKLLEEAKNWNNWISYLWELIALAGGKDLPRYAKRFGELRSGMELVKKIYNDGTGNLTGLDTLTKACDLLGERVEAAHYRERLRRSLSVDKLISSEDRLSVQYTLDTTLPDDVGGQNDAS